MPASMKLIVFDIGQVLIYFNISPVVQWIAKFSPLEPPQVSPRIFGKPLGIDFECGKISGQEFFDLLCKELKIPENTRPPYDLFVQAFNHIFKPNDAVLNIMSRLSLQYTIGIISNTNKLHYDYLIETYPVLKQIPYQVLSFETGLRKPDRRMYEIIVSRAGIDPSDVLMIDDKRENIEGAHTAGFDAILYMNTETLHKELAKRNLLSMV